MSLETWVGNQSIIQPKINSETIDIVHKIIIHLSENKTGIWDNPCHLAVKVQFFQVENDKQTLGKF